ncbi:phage minor head protein [Thalassospiraceae bacterium LMO-JJ14]|nr:phage minor head protein [Thalassospiraceae bacterium LMO-JJ14]
MTKRFSLKAPLASNANVDLDDAMETKIALRRLGYYKTPGYGMTPYPDDQLFDAVTDLQRDKGLRRTGEVRPGDDTEKAIRVALAESGKKSGKYIWRTRGDSKVRSAHAERDGKVFDWDNPPEGGHPGEAPNCRCLAEDVKDNKAACARLKLQLEVDGNNLDAAKTRFNIQDNRVNEQSMKLKANRAQKAKLATEARVYYSGASIESLLRRRLDPGAPADLVRILVAYGELELEYARLAEEFKLIEKDREYALKDVNEALAILRNTWRKFELLECSDQ